MISARFRIGNCSYTTASQKYSMNKEAREKQMRNLAAPGYPSVIVARDTIIWRWIRISNHPILWAVWPTGEDILDKRSIEVIVAFNLVNKAESP